MPLPESAADARRLVFTGQQQVTLQSFEPPPPQPGEVSVRTHLSLMSTGTENIVFNRLFAPDTHWDRWVKYPFYPGYTSVGEVLAVGPQVGGFKVGDRVAYRAGHSSHAVVKETNCFPIPDGLPWHHAAWFALAKIALNGILSADVGLGDRVLVVGAGPIGQMALRWVNAAGAERILLVEPAKERLALALAGGATSVIAEPIASAREAVLAANDGELPNVVIDSTGNVAVFAAALGLVATQGTVVVLGDTGAPAEQKLSSDVITRALRIVGTHDGQLLPGWTNARIMQLFFRLALSRRFSLEGVDTHYFRPEDCANAYATANRERATTMGILFDWTGERGVG